MSIKRFPVPSNEEERLKALKRYNILDTLSDSEFDRVVHLIAYICDVPIAHISFLDENRQWFKSIIGLDATEVPREISFCQYTIMGTEMVEIPNTLENDNFKEDPNVIEGLKVRFYAGIPLVTPDGYSIGTVCAIGFEPKKLNEDQKKAISILSKHIMTLLELRNKNVELEEQTKIAELAVYAKDSFLANMSHEIRTPLNAIMGFTDLLAQSNLDSIQRDYISNVQTAGENLLLIVNDILDLSKIESGNLIIESYPFNLKEILKHLYNLLKVKIKDNIEFNLFLDADMPDIVIGDKGRINQIIMNLAGNAIKFTEEGEITISVKVVEETNEKYTLRFSVKDTGIGITQDKLDTIFDRFTQAEESTTRKFGGTGLGLNIVKQLVELQKGEIQVKSKIGRGSEFFFLLDYLKSNSVVESVIEVVSCKKPVGKISILLCEDNLLNQKLANSVIQNFGFELDIAMNGQEGIDMMLKKQYDLILMDLQMPVLDGYQATIYIRNELKSSIPIIAMTAHSLVGEQQKCFDIGMDAYIPKPFKQSELLNAILSVLEKNTVEDTTIKTINFSYLNDVSGRNLEFINEMINLFIDKIPSEIDLLEKAILDNDHSAAKKLTHDMRSSLSLFKLEQLFEYLEGIDAEANQANFSSLTIEKFEALKCELVNTIEALKAHAK